MEQDLIEYMAKSLVNNPDAVETKLVSSEKTTIVELHVAEGDEGKIIGKRGTIAQAMRTILQAASSKSGRRFVLEITA